MRYPNTWKRLRTTSLAAPEIWLSCRGGRNVWENSTMLLLRKGGLSYPWKGVRVELAVRFKQKRRTCIRSPGLGIRRYGHHPESSIDLTPWTVAGRTELGPVSPSTGSTVSVPSTPPRIDMRTDDTPASREPHVTRHEFAFVLDCSCGMDFWVGPAEGNKGIQFEGQ